MKKMIRTIVYLLIIFYSALVVAQEDTLAALNAKIDKLDSQHKELEIKNALSRLEALNPPKNLMVQPQEPVSTIPVPGQPAPMIPSHPATSVPVTNHQPAPVVPTNNTATQPSMNIYR